MVARLGAINVFRTDATCILSPSARSTIESWVATMKLSAQAFCSGMPGAIGHAIILPRRSSEDSRPLFALPSDAAKSQAREVGGTHA
jgi:hypothetical protein